MSVRKTGKDRGMQLIFSKFDSFRTLWDTVSKITSRLDALGALAKTSSQVGYYRPVIAACPPNINPFIHIKHGRHPCVENVYSGGDFIPNSLYLGGTINNTDKPRVLLLSGPNMGGKSTLLRQTCLLIILAQIGCFVPAEECIITPIDRIFTRLGALDRILLRQSTFFVELAETTTALRGATRRSLVIMDELGRGTSTFDGTAIASATVRHLVENNKCLSLFATHYHSLLDEWKENKFVRLGHMECIVDDKGNKEEDAEIDNKITFLYTLGAGSCPRSFGINVASLALLPEEVLSKAKRISSDYESKINSVGRMDAVSLMKEIEKALLHKNWELIERYWENLQE